MVGLSSDEELSDGCISSLTISTAAASVEKQSATQCPNGHAGQGGRFGGSDQWGQWARN